MANERGRGARFALLGVIGLLFWAFIYAVLYRLLVYFRGVPDLGPFLAGKLLGLILVGFFSILLLSNIITALSSFFLARTSTCWWRRRWTGSSSTARSCWRRR